MAVCCNRRVCEQNTLTRHLFIVFLGTHNNVEHDINSKWLSASCHPCFMRSILIPFRLSTLYSTSFSWSSSSSSMWVGSKRIPLCASANEEPDSCVDNAPLTGQKSGDKTTWTKNSWRLLAVTIWRAVFQRRQLQFPSRYQWACKNDTAESVSEFCHATDASRTRSHRGESPSGRMFRLSYKDYFKGTCTNSFCEKWHLPECLFYKSESGCRFGEKCSHAHRQVEEQPSTRSKKNSDKSAVAMLKVTRQLGCAIKDMEPPKSSSILRKSSDLRKPIRCVRFTKAVVRHADIRDQNPSLGMICPGDLQHRHPNAPKFEDRSQEETEWQERCAREAVWKLRESILKLKKRNKAAFLLTFGKLVLACAIKS